jgi:hypothetical protein
MKKVLTAALVLGLLVPTVSQAATTAPTATKPAVKTVAGAEGTAKHETSEANTGTGEEGLKVTKGSKAKKSVIKKKLVKKAAKKK